MNSTIYTTDIKRYTQIYDVLRTLKYSDYISDKRDVLHKSLYDTAIQYIIENVNMYLSDNAHSVKGFNEIQKIVDKLKTYNICEDFKNDVVFNNFQFIELKNPVWYKPSNLNIIYTKQLVPHGKRMIRVLITNISLEPFWDINYLLKDNFNKLLVTKNTNFSINYIDYINGKVELFDKNTHKNFCVDLNSLESINDYEFTNNYNSVDMTIKQINIIQ